MIFFELLLKYLWLISIDCFIAFILWNIYRYIDFKYFSSLEITTLKEENKYLKEENKKINGTSANFWEDKI